MKSRLMLIVIALALSCCVSSADDIEAQQVFDDTSTTTQPPPHSDHAVPNGVNQDDDREAWESPAIIHEEAHVQQAIQQEIMAVPLPPPNLDASSSNDNHQGGRASSPSSLDEEYRAADEPERIIKQDFPPNNVKVDRSVPSSLDLENLNADQLRQLIHAMNGSEQDVAREEEMREYVASSETREQPPRAHTDDGDDNNNNNNAASNNEIKEELFDDRTLLDVFGEVAKEFLTQELIPETDAECRWDWRSVRCEPACECALDGQLWDYHLGRACRRRAFVDDTCVPVNPATVLREAPVPRRVISLVSQTVEILKAKVSETAGRIRETSSRRLERWQRHACKDLWELHHKWRELQHQANSNARVCIPESQIPSRSIPQRLLCGPMDLIVCGSEPGEGLRDMMSRRLATDADKDRVAAMLKSGDSN